MKYVFLIAGLLFFTFDSNTQNSKLPIGNLVESEDLFKELSYRCVGPTRGGRVTAVAGIEDKPSTFFMGATGGGVWKTTDYGQNWKNVSDGYFATPSIGSIGISKTDSDIIYVGTGSDGIRSNVITGKGVYKSRNGGKSWKHMGLEKTGQIGAVLVHPNEPNTVFVAAIGQAFSANKERGVFRTKDGGDNWEQVFFISDSTGAVDLEFHPNNPDVIYASMWQTRRKPWTIISGGYEGGIFKTTDGGENWKQMKNGLPDGLFGKSDLAVSADAPDRVWALVEAPDGKGGVYRSNDAGDSFEQVNNARSLQTRPFYFCNIDVSPVDADHLFVSTVPFLVSKNGGKDWSRMRTPHSDNHDLWINPSQPNTWIQANDGGANITLDGGQTWSTQSNQATAELYQVEVDDQFPYWLYAGQQDNSTIAVPSHPPYNSPVGPSAFWMAVGGCETGPAVPKPGNPNIVYSNCKGRFGTFNKLTGQEKRFYVGAENWYSANPKDLKYRFQRVAPIHVSPHNPDVVYHGSQFVHKTINDGENWETISPDLTAFKNDRQVISGKPITRDITGEEYYSTIYEIIESELEPGLIWVGSNDGLIHVTKDGGDNWTNVTPKGLPEGGRVDCIDPSKLEKGKAYAAIHRYLMGDWTPYIYKTEDYGANWELITDGTNGIPNDFPTRVIRADKNIQGLLFAGTEFGIFVSMDDGDSWTSLQLNLPVTPITDMKIFRKDLIISTMGRSFWILDDISVIQQSKFAMKDRLQVFQPRATYRMRYRGSRGEQAPSYPGAHAKIFYHLPETIESGDFSIEIQNAEKKPVYFYDGKISNKLKLTKGLHVLNWDLLNYGKKSSSTWSDRGPMVSPGYYTLILKAGKQETTAPLRVLMDPRVKASGLSISDLKAQEKLHLDVLALKKEIAATLEELKEKRGEAKTDGTKKILDGLIGEIETARGTYQRPMLMDQIGYLKSMISSADQMPGKDAFDRLLELKAWHSKLKEKLKKMDRS